MTRRRGFSLIELMVSMVFLAVIMLMVARILGDTSQSWDLVRRRGHSTSVGRSVLGLMADELGRAVGGESLPFVVGPGRVAFWTQHAEGAGGGGDRRSLVRVEYRLESNPDSPDFHRLVRRQAVWTGGSPSSDVVTSEMTDWAHDFAVVARDGQGQRLADGSHDRLPAHVDLYLTLGSWDDAQGFADMTALRQAQAARRFTARIHLPGAWTHAEAP